MVRCAGFTLFLTVCLQESTLPGAEAPSGKAAAYQAPCQLQDGLKTSDLSEIKCNKKGLEALVRRAGNGAFGQINSILIAKDGVLFMEQYFNDAGMDVLHKQMSVTKSITSLCVGKALEMRKINSVDDPILEYLPEVNQSKVLPGIKKITIRDCLSMSSGIRYDRTKLRGKRFTQKDHVPFLLEETVTEVVTSAGRFDYSYVDPVIISHVLYNATGKTIEEMAEEHIFKPLRIKNYDFANICGLTFPVSGMFLRSRDMMKIGLMTINDGVWNGKQIIDQSYLKEATSEHAVVKEFTNYGYFYWLYSIPAGNKTYVSRSAMGAGGQMINVVKELGLVMVFTGDKSNSRAVMELFVKNFCP